MIYLWHSPRFVDFDKPPYVCPQCGRRSRLCMRHDAYYCPACDIWLEPVCGSERHPRSQMPPAKGMAWMVDYKRLGGRIRQVRLDRGLTQAELAELADVSTPYDSHVERGVKTISLNTLTRVAESLDTTLDSLLLGQQVSDQNAYGTEVAALLEDCSPAQRQTLYEITQAVKKIICEKRS